MLKKLNIAKHELVSKHVILNEKEKEELLKKYNITLRQLPRILSSDPIIKSLEGKVGDVVKIIRDSSTAGESVYFRVVMKG